MSPPRFRSCAIACAFATVLPAADVSVAIDWDARQQLIEGFGSTCNNWADDGGDAMGAMRPQIIDAIYGQVRLSMGDVHCSPYEGTRIDAAKPVNWANLSKSNDNGDPDSFAWDRFHWWRSDPARTLLYDLARPKGFANVLLSGRVSTRWADQWLNTIRSTDRNLYLAEAAENAVAIVRHWKDAYGYEPAWHQPFNEPLSGNNEVYGGTTQEVVDLTKAIGDRLRREGFLGTRLVVASEETASKSLATAQAIMNDPQARQYVGAISYHCYPYGSTYAKASRILATSGSGNPNASDVQVRRDLRTLAVAHGVQVWMTEVSHSEADDWTTCRARAIHIHDELRYAGISSYWAMFNAFDSSQQDERDHVVIFNGGSQTWSITGIGRAIGHYARWLTPKQSRWLGGSSSDSMVQIAGFADASQQRLVAVLMNNASSSRRVAVDLAGARLRGDLTGEQSTSSAWWQPVPAQAADLHGFALDLPATSVTTIAVATCPRADVDRDGRVDANDLALVRMSFGRRSSDVGWDRARDLDDNGRIDAADVGLVTRGLSP